jgi:hypothetical protein
MYMQLAMGFGLDLDVPAALETSYEVPKNFARFWGAVEPAMLEIIKQHPNVNPQLRALDESIISTPDHILRQFEHHMITVPVVKNPPNAGGPRLMLPRRYLAKSYPTGNCMTH